MPYADPEKSFEVAVRHLFRNLHNGRAIQRNPLIKSIKTQALARSPNACSAAIRATVLRVASLCRSEDAKAGREAQGIRRYKIIAAICAGDAPEKTAADLGLSVRQYYRDRKAICARVARSLHVPKAPSFLTDIPEPLQLLLRRADSLVDQGFALKAVDLLEEALGQMSSTRGRIVTFLTRCSALVHYGDTELAADSLEDAKRLLDDSQRAGCDQGVFRDLITLRSVEVARASGRDADAASMLDALAQKHKHSRDEEPLSDELALDIFLEQASYQITCGHFTTARETLKYASEREKTMDNVRPDLRVYLAIATAFSSEDGLRSADESALLYHEALDLSLSLSSAQGTFYSMHGLSSAYLRMGDEDRAYTWFQNALQVARSMEGTAPLIAAAVAGIELLSTRYWRRIGPLLQEAHLVARPSTLNWTMLSTANGIYLRRLGELRDALEPLRAAADVAASLHNTPQIASALREQGLVLHLLGRTGEAGECIREALEFAKVGTSATSLQRTYSAAATILTNWRQPSHARS